MRQTWRWFGPADLATIDDVVQAGAEGSVSALHHVPNGVTWTPEEIARRQELIRHRKDGSLSGIEWEVIESLPVSEDIKKQKLDWREHVENYKTGIRNVQVNHYSVGSGDVSAPIRVSYFAVRASTDKCGRWPEDLMQNSENKHYANFGCSYQNNLAAQVANPNDLVGPRRPGEIDAEKRGNAIGDYQDAVSDWSPESDYQW